MSESVNVLTDINNKLAVFLQERKTKITEEESMLLRQIMGFSRQLVSNYDRQILHGYKKLYFAGMRGFEMVLSNVNTGGSQHTIVFDSAVWPHYYSHCLVNGVPVPKVRLEDLKLGDVITLNEEAPIVKGFTNAEVEKVG
jgi:hypothetical protein